MWQGINESSFDGKGGVEEVPEGEALPLRHDTNDLGVGDEVDQGMVGLN